MSSPINQFFIVAQKSPDFKLASKILNLQNDLNKIEFQSEFFNKFPTENQLFDHKTTEKLCRFIHSACSYRRVSMRLDIGIIGWM